MVYKNANCDFVSGGGEPLNSFNLTLMLDGLGGYWLSQTPTEKGNPFFGQNDKKCGGIISEMPSNK